MKLLLDTSIVIDKLRNGYMWDTFWQKADHEHELYLSSVVIFELFSGKSTRRTETVRKIDSLLAYFQIIDVNRAISQRAGEIYRDLKIVLQVPDYIIAATALDIGAEVVTLNRRHFAKIPGIRIYDF